MLMSLLLLTACQIPGFGTGNTEGKGDGTVYSSTVSVTVLIGSENAPDYILNAGAEIYQHIREKGISVSLEHGSSKVSGSVIAVGDSECAASAHARERIREEYVTGNVCYSICYKDSVLAIDAADETSFEAVLECFFSDYLKSDKLQVDVNLDYFVNMDCEDYMDFIEDKKRVDELSGWNDRWSSLDGVLDSEAVSAIKELYALYGDGVYEWMANLWSADVGGFYYSISARDYETFLPDLESTRQVLAIIRTSGMVRVYGDNDDKAFVSAFPIELKNKIVAFVKSCQNAEDGYFYHKQWGSDVSFARRGRDLGWAIELLALFGEEPDYPTALDRISGEASEVMCTPALGATTVQAVSRVQKASKSSLPPHLQSEEAFIAYLDSFDFEANSHDTAHVIGSQSAEIKAAGLIDVCCDYFDRKQQEIYDAQVASDEKPTGLWQREVNYTSISGLYKIGGLYSTAGRSMKYLNECVESAIECIKANVEPSVIIYVFNPWAGLHTAVSAMKRAVDNGSTEYDLDATYRRIRSECASLMSITTEKLAVFAKETGGFSYNRENSAPTTQGTSVSLGVAEGDVNATNIAVNSISGLAFASMGIDRVPIWNSEDFDRWISIIQSFDSDVEKKPVEKLSLDFEDFGEGEIPIGITATSPSGVVSDGDNMAFCFYDAADVGTKSLINTGINGSFECAAVEMDVKFKSFSGNVTTHQIKFRGAKGNMYMATFKISGKNLIIGDSSHTGGGITGPLKITVPHSEWTKLRFEFYTDADREVTESGFIVKIYVNGNLAGESVNYFGPTVVSPTGIAPAIGLTTIEVYGMGAAGSELLIDNLTAEPLPGQKYESKQ